MKQIDKGITKKNRGKAIMEFDLTACSWLAGYNIDTLNKSKHPKHFNGQQKF